jgi:hypothetical protein
MPYTPPSNIPVTFVAGDSFRITLDEYTSYPTSEGWQVALSFRAHGSNPIDLTSFTTGTGYGFDIPAASTSAWAKGGYNWTTKAVKGAEKFTVGTGYMEVRPDPTTVDASDDVRSHAQKMLDLIEAALSGRITSDMESYQIAGRQISKIPFSELHKMREQYLSEIESEEAATLGRPQRTIVAQFNRL